MKWRSGMGGSEARGNMLLDDSKTRMSPFPYYSASFSLQSNFS
jgi:hypothetical protein